MAKAEFHMTLDASLLIQAYNKGMEDAFILIEDSYDKFGQMEAQLNVSKIDLPDE